MLEMFSQIAGIEQQSGHCVLFMQHVATQQTTDFLIIVEIKICIALRSPDLPV